MLKAIKTLTVMFSELSAGIVGSISCIGKQENNSLTPDMLSSCKENLQRYEERRYYDKLKENYFI